MKNTLKVSVLICAVISIPVQATELYDVVKYELGGVKAGYTPEETRQALAEFYSIDPDKMVSKYTDELYDMTGLKDAEYFFSYREGEIGLSVWFDASLQHKDKGYMIVKSVKVTFRSDYWKEVTEFQKKILDGAVSEHGPATIQDQSSDLKWSYLWCAQLNVEKNGCAQDEASFVVNDYKTELRFW